MITVNAALFFWVDLVHLSSLLKFIKIAALLNGIPALSYCLRLLFGLFPRPSFRRDGLFFPSREIEMLRTFTTSPLRVALRRTLGGVACIDRNCLGLGAKGTEIKVVQDVHIRRVVFVSCKSLALLRNRI
jgi:hypothetical protein